MQNFLLTVVQNIWFFLFLYGITLSIANIIPCSIAPLKPILLLSCNIKADTDFNRLVTSCPNKFDIPCTPTYCYSHRLYVDWLCVRIKMKAKAKRLLITNVNTNSLHVCKHIKKTTLYFGTLQDYFDVALWGFGLPAYWISVSICISKFLNCIFKIPHF